MEEFTDEKTGMRLTVELEAGERKITAFPPDNQQEFTYEDLYEAVHRLLRMAGIEKEQAS